MRLATLLSCTLLASAVATAADAKDKPTPAKAEQFIDRSNILVPEKVGDFVVESHTQDPNVFGGVSIGYDEPAKLPPSFTVTAYVYPIGRMGESDALAAGVSHIVEGVKGRDDYTERKIDPETPFAVPAPTQELLAKRARKRETVIGPSGEAPPATPATDADMTAALGELTPSGTTTGRRVLIHMNMHGVPVRSIGYVFYRQMMLVKLRITVNADEIDEAGFLALADQTATSLAPTYLVQNFGDCGVVRIPLGNEGEEDKSEGKSGAVALMREMGRVAREGCAAAEGEPDPLPKGMLRHTLVYPAGTWK